MRFVVMCIVALCITGCEVSLSVFLEKDWRTDPHRYTGNDAVSKIELKITKQIPEKKKKEK